MAATNQQNAEIGRRAASNAPEAGLGGVSREDAPVEIVRVLNPYRAEPTSEEHAARSRAGMLAAWLRDGGDKADLPPLPVPQAPDRAEETQNQPDAELGKAYAEGLTTQARQLALRLQILGGEISQQRFGPRRRWAILDIEGSVLETPESVDVDALVEHGFLALSRFERGAAIWRLQPETIEGRAAYCDTAKRSKN